MAESLTSLGSELSVWMNDRDGDTCISCGGTIEYSALGMDHGQSGHRIECDCTVIECRGKS